VRIAGGSGCKLNHRLKGAAVHADGAVAPRLRRDPAQDLVDLSGARLERRIHDPEG